MAVEQTVGANYFMTYHTILRNSKDFYTALREARAIAHNITVEINQGRSENDTTVEVFPYSIFYVFYEQYLTVFSEAVASMFISIATVFIVMLVFSGFDFYSSVIVAIGLFVLLINMAGCMYWFDVSLNAVSLVNLIMVRRSSPRLLCGAVFSLGYLIAIVNNIGQEHFTRNNNFFNIK